MISRFLSVLLILWGLGFAGFAVSLPGPLEGSTTDAVVVPTGGPGRIDRGLELMRERQAKRMLVTGVAPGVRPRDLAATYPDSGRLFRCCVDLGGEAVDTRSNAEETARWLRGHRYRTVRLVTSDWHLPRARMELEAAMGRDAVILGDGVKTEPRLGTLFNEYNKLLLRRVALWVGIGG
ncbi:YdcF family protein [Sphingomonas lenta]|uniref:YdcF family protein n=1 Tax=Sphingomonas lenta TaxID=1141887 RepID=UPI0015957712|nr:YdcF family protein [Sphingomonas lenta]